MFSKRAIHLLIFLICSGLLAYVLYVQYVEFLDPCPLCILQRIAYISMGLFALVAVLHNPQRVGWLVYGVFVWIAGILGIFVASRHVWLQHLPKDQVPDCGPGLSYMFETMPMGAFLEKVLGGSGECADVVWNFMGLSMPTWSLIMFVGLLSLSFFAFLKNRA